MRDIIDGFPKPRPTNEAELARLAVDLLEARRVIQFIHDETITWEGSHEQANRLLKKIHRRTREYQEEYA